jgi:hypothetical protein
MSFKIQKNVFSQKKKKGGSFLFTNIWYQRKLPKKMRKRSTFGNIPGFGRKTFVNEVGRKMSKYR